MNAKAKANELYGNHYQIAMNSTNPKYRSSQVIKGHCITHVNGIIEQFESIGFRTSIGGVISYEGGQLIDKIQYWRDVLTELNQM